MPSSTRRALWHDTLVNLSAHPAGWPLARIARRIAPIVKVPGLGLVVNDAEIAHTILVNDAMFTKNGEGSLSSTMTEMLGPFALANMDGEPHAQLRAKLTDVVSPANVAELLEGCRLPLDDMFARLSAGESVDLVQTMKWMSGRVTFDMLGVDPPGDSRTACHSLVDLGERIASGFDFRKPSRARLDRVRGDVAQLEELARRGYLDDNAPSRSFVRRLRDIGLRFEEARGVMSLVFLAGTLTTAAAMPRILALLVDSGSFPLLQRDRAGIPSAIAEGLRYTAPVPATMRIAQPGARMNNESIREGTRLILLTCNMARDPKLFETPDEFIPARKQPVRARHLWFGAGPHFCLGFAVAQRQLHMVMEMLASLNGDLEIVGRRSQRSVIVAGYRELHLRLVRRS